MSGTVKLRAKWHCHKALIKIISYFCFPVLHIEYHYHTSRTFRSFQDIYKIYISSLVTCVLFGLYVVGHIGDYENNKVFRQEKFENVYIDNIEETDNVIVLDEIGTTFSISSAKGIRKIIYKSRSWRNFTTN